MQLGYEGSLFILAFDHRGSFKKLLGVKGEASPDQTEQLVDAKRLVWEGVQIAVREGLPSAAAGVLVDEEMGAGVAEEAKAAGLLLAMPVEKSGQDIFDFEYGEEFGTHIERFDPSFSKVLVRWNPDDPEQVRELQGERLARLTEWLHARQRKFLFELLVPATPAQVALVSGDAEAYDTEVRPYLTLAAIAEIQAAGVEPDIWKIEGLDRRRDCQLLAELIRRDGREGVKAVVLGRGSGDARLDHWLEMGAPVDGYIGFAIGRSIWSPGLAGVANSSMSREQAAADIAKRYRRFVDVYTRAAEST